MGHVPGRILVDVDLVCVLCVHSFTAQTVVVGRWWPGLVVARLLLIIVVTLHRARLVLGWVTICRWVNHLGM